MTWWNESSVCHFNNINIIQGQSVRRKFLVMKIFKKHPQSVFQRLSLISSLSTSFHQQPSVQFSSSLFLCCLSRQPNTSLFWGHFQNQPLAPHLHIHWFHNIHSVRFSGQSRHTVPIYLILTNPSAKVSTVRSWCWSWPFLLPNSSCPVL